MMRNLTSIYISLFLFSISAVTQAAPPAKDVNVVNTPDVNVVSMPPIEANVNGPIEATINDPVEVLVNEMPGVMIDNGPSNPVPVIQESYPRIIYQAEASAVMEPGQGRSRFSNFLPMLPETGTLVIEYINVHAVFEGDEYILSWSLQTYTDANRIIHALKHPTAHPMEDPTRKLYKSTQNLRLYHQLSGPVPLTFEFSRYPNNSLTVVIASISGYIVPEGSPSLAP